MRHNHLHDPLVAQVRLLAMFRSARSMSMLCTSYVQVTFGRTLSLRIHVVKTCSKEPSKKEFGKSPAQANSRDTMHGLCKASIE